MGGYKLVILDKADYRNPRATQPSARGFIEGFSDNCRFIMTCNFKNRIIEPLHSRCGVYEFNTNKKSMAPLCGDFMARVTDILKIEKVEMDNQQGVAELIMKHAPDWRRILNELQRASIGGELKISNLNKTDASYEALYKSLKEKNFKTMRQWVTNNIDVDSSVIFRTIYDQMFENIDQQSIPQLVLILADYQYKDAFVADHELNMVACLTEVMANVELA